MGLRRERGDDILFHVWTLDLDQCGALGSGGERQGPGEGVVWRSSAALPMQTAMIQHIRHCSSLPTGYPGRARLLQVRGAAK